MSLENQSDNKVEVKIKTAVDHNGKQYWFAEDEKQKEFFFADKQDGGHFSPEPNKIAPELAALFGENGWQFYSLQKLEEALNKYVELKKVSTRVRRATRRATGNRRATTCKNNIYLVPDPFQNRGKFFCYFC